MLVADGVGHVRGYRRTSPAMMELSVLRAPGPMQASPSRLSGRVADLRGGTSPVTVRFVAVRFLADESGDSRTSRHSARTEDMLPRLGRPLPARTSLNGQNGSPGAVFSQITPSGG